ncbi:MAG: class I SAM-dependent methyltransferase [Proteobacteria bacterium]|nr:class I SAM-dependent methyltransferase [Pseudomonadota bacterium]
MLKDDWASQLLPRLDPSSTDPALRQRLYGVARYAKRAAAYWVTSALLRRWDRYHRVDTGGWFRFDGADTAATHAKRGYDVVSTPPSIFKFMARYFPPTLATYTYVDIGSGKGRTVLLASEMGFKRAVGVDLSEFACDIARKNLLTYRSSACPRSALEIVNADATHYALPDGDLLLFFNNPFGVDVWADMVRNVAAAPCQDRKITIVLIGSFPDAIKIAAERLESMAGFRIRAKGMTPRFWDSYARFHFFVLDGYPRGQRDPIETRGSAELRSGGHA